jgi:tRNA threonylcarbamoyladenosine biosynthesis protein TsaE
MIITTEQEMVDFGKKLAEVLVPPVTVELIGDVGVGKTTLVKGLARGLGVNEVVNSPSFTLSKSYEGRGVILVHYDFYRLVDPGLLAGELAEAVGDKNTVTVVEWGESVADVLPERRVRVEIKYREDGGREVEVKK